MPLVIDTSVALAALDTADPDHARCEELLLRAATVESLLIPSTVLVELAYWVVERLGREAWATFVADLMVGAYEYEIATMSDIRRAQAIDEQYAGLGLGLVDASIMAIAERLDEQRIATLNERDFRPITPAHCGYWTLLPADG